MWSQDVSYRNFNAGSGTYDASQVFPTNQIADDFGPRDLGDDWHGGVDYNSGPGNSDFGDMLLTPESGTFPDVNNLIRGSQQQIRYQVVDAGGHRYTFIHMFDKHNNQRWYNDSTIYVANLLNSPDRWGMVILIDGDTIKLGQVNNGQIVYRGDTLTVTNSIDQYDPIGILGNSGQYTNSQGVLTDYIAHLHLNTVPDSYNTSGGDAVNSDPLQYVNYSVPNYTINVWSQLNSSGIDISYPGDNATKIASRVQMSGEPQNVNRYDHVMDVNNVEIKIKPADNINFERIMGASEESIISLGARLGEPLINHNQNHNYPGTIHQWTVTGVNSNAYNGDTSGPNARNPWDDYFFTDFIPRIHEDDPMDGAPAAIADCPQSARYNDGKYELKTVVTNITNIQDEGTPIEFTLDNFQPFIEQVTAKIGLHVIYDKVWVCEDSCSGNTGGISLNNPLPEPECPYSQIVLNDKITVEVVSSEPLEELGLNVPALSAFNLDPTSVTFGNRFWTFEVPYELVQLQGSMLGVTNVTFFFSGKDFSDNPLLDLSSFAQTDCTILPTRQANGWSSNNIPTGAETTHYFTWSCGEYRPVGLSSEETVVSIISDENCIEIDYTVSAASGPWVANGSIELDPPTGGIPPYTYNWSNGATTSNLSDVLPGPYCVVITDAFCCEKEVCIDVPFECAPIIIDASVICICPSSTGQINANVTGGSGNYDYAWSPPLEEILNPMVYSPGTYTLTVTDLDNGCTTSLEVEVENCNFDLTSYLAITPDCNEEGTSTIDLEIPQGMGAPPYLLTWIKVGAGLVEKAQSADGRASLENMDEGEYCLTVQTANGCEEQLCGINVTAAPPIEINSSVQTISAPGASDGIIYLSANLLVESYNWSNAPTLGPPGQNWNLSAGTYSVTVTYHGGVCEEVLEFELLDCGDLANAMDNAQAEVTAPSSAGNDGAIDIINISDTYPGYGFTYIWTKSGHPGTFSTEEDISGLSEGLYCLQISLGQCNYTTSVPLCREICSFELDVVSDPVDCEKIDLSANVSPTNGYTYAWSNGSDQPSITVDIGIADYCVTVTDPGGCTGQRCITPQMEPLVIESEVTNSTGQSNNGSITVTAEGGMPGYTFEWSTGGTTPSLGPLAPDTYTVTVADQCNTTASLSVTIQCEFGPDDLVAEVVHVPCAGQGGGSINLLQLPNIQNPNFRFLWSNGKETQNNDNILVGNYCVTITEINSGCFMSTCFDVETDGNEFDVGLDIESQPCQPVNNGQIRAHPGGNSESPYSYNWHSPWYYSYNGHPVMGDMPVIYHLPMGYYYLTVTDSRGCTGRANTYLGWQQPFTFDVTADPNPLPCDGSGTSFGNIELTSGTIKPPYTATWKRNSPPEQITVNSSLSVSDLTAGVWKVTLENDEGCKGYGAVTIETASTIELTADVQAACSGPTGSITLQTVGGTTGSNPFIKSWDDGFITYSDVRSDLEFGTYFVTVTDAAGCTATGGYFVPPATLRVSSVNIDDNGCNTDCNGSISLLVSHSSEPSYSWSNGANTRNIEDLCEGDYTVTITSDECTLVETYTVEGPGIGQVTEHESEVEWWFENSGGEGSAAVRIYCDAIEEYGWVAIFTSDPSIPPTPTHIAGKHVLHGTSGETYIEIPNQHQNESEFYFGCLRPWPNEGCMTYSGKIEQEIRTCINDPDEGFNFGEITPLGNNSPDPCDPNATHSYDIEVHYIADNFPYLIDVTMINPDGTETLVSTKVITSYTIGVDDDIRIDGVPPGTVKFTGYNKYCMDTPYYAREHTNCCAEFSCDLISEGSSPEWEDSYYHSFPFVTLETRKECFDGDCSGLFNLGDKCSNLLAKTKNGTHCWAGTVHVEFPGEHQGWSPSIPFSFDVNEDGFVENKVGDDIWVPPGPGTYIIRIVYEGSGNHQNCTQYAEVNFYGPSNINHAIGFNNDYWFNRNAFGIPDSYYGTWTCGTCNADKKYLFQNNQGSCKFYDNWQFTFFKWEPINTGNPCFGGGTLTYIDFDENGYPTTQELTLDANSHVITGEVPHIQPLGNTTEIWCKESGGCLFDANELSNQIYDVNVDLPLFATWGDDCEQVVWPDPDNPNPNPPCSDVGEECPFGTTCHEGDCYPNCVEGECISGECHELGFCVPEEGCAPPCPNSDYICENNTCYLNEDICNFYEAVSGGGGETIYRIYHGLPAGKILQFRFRTYGIPDRLLVNDVQLISCVTTIPDDPNDVEVATYTTNGEPDIKITVRSCGSAGSKWNLRVTCLNLDDDPPVHKSSIVKPNPGEIVFHPNPFVSKFDITAHNIEEPFKGQVVVLDNFGRQITKRDFIFTAGYNSFDIDGLENLANGFYFIMVKKEGEVYSSMKVVKME